MSKVEFLNYDNLPNLNVKYRNINNLNLKDFSYSQSKFIKKLNKDPIQFFIDRYSKIYEKNYWLIIDPLFSPFNRFGDEYHFDERDNFSVNDLSCLCDKGKNLLSILNFVLGDNTVIVIYKKETRISKNINLNKDWEDKKIIVYMECTDSLFWDIVSDTKTLKSISNSYQKSNFNVSMSSPNIQA